ncbi:fimbrial protein [Bordetella genomosp. 1]|uniref:Fimbrial protein n=1 Tax=Bordetella genomosp. 1 TaxID=1395607 RepID=A0ABX4EWX5_9BORD|nr:fimbrial protein [Bordetella genomosp. 1]OZI58532.1 fimbrial protein [Bordetella genomosp. 1]
MPKFPYAKLALAAAIGLASQGAFADDGTIDFIGEIVDAPCSIAPESQNLVVPLGKVSKAELSAAGKKSTPAVFKIKLLNCGASAKGATVTFNGATDATVKDTLSVTAGKVSGSGASGVAVELQDSSGAKIPVGAPSNEYALNVGDNPLVFKAVYVATAAATPGAADATAQFTVTYK